MNDRFTIDGIEEIFRDDVRRLTATMRRGLEILVDSPGDTKAIDDVRATGHSLKGAASLVGFTYLSRSGALFEALGEVAANASVPDLSSAQNLFRAMHVGLPVIQQLLEMCMSRMSDLEQKPFYVSLFASLPDEWTSKVPGALAPDAERPESRPASISIVEPAPVPPAPPEEDEFARELAAAFAEELQELVQGVPDQVRLLGSIDTRPAAAHRLNRVFHTIKGSAAMVGLNQLSEAGKRLEKFFEKPELLLTNALHDAQKDVVTVFDAANLTVPSLAAAMEAPTPVAAPTAIEGIDRELLEAFNIDAAESIERTEQLLLGLERQPDDREMLQALFRQYHTLKGAAGAVGLQTVAAQLHEGESLLEAVTEGHVAIDGGRLVDFLFRLSDSVVALINIARGISDPRHQVMTDLSESLAALHAESAVPYTGAERAVAIEEAELLPAVELRTGIAPEAEAGVVRVQAARLDALLNQVGQLVVTRTRMDQKIHSFADLRNKLEYCRKRLADTIEGFQKRFEFTIGEPVALPSAPSAVDTIDGDSRRKSSADELFTDLEFDKYDDFNILARSVIELASDTGEVAEQIDDFIELLGEEVRQFSKITSGLQRQITNLRLVPIDVVFRRLQRPVRDVARQEGKQVELVLAGGDVQLDRGVIDALYTPLLHIVRNAVSHGIELPGVREVSGKARTGQLRITATSRHNSVTLAVEDDGAGINFDRIMTKGIRLGMIDAGSPPGREQLLSLIFQPGFSTADSITDISGRGVGMDVVAKQVAALNGSVLVDSKPGEGTAIRLALPITTSIDEVLLLGVGSQVYALPVDFVERVITVEPDTVIANGSRRSVVVDDEEIPALLLAPMVGEESTTGNAVGIVLRAGDRALVLIGDHVHSQQEVVIRPLNKLLEAHPFLAASTISGAGEVIFVLHIGRLFDILAVANNAAIPSTGVATPVPFTEVTAPATAILVVDDSISVRKLAVRFLESEGLEVETAVDGLDALEKLAAGRFRLVITDLEMPRMHGYDLVQAIRNSPRFAHLPVIVCTSRSTDKHRKRAKEVGAEGYVTKPFSKEEVLAEILRVTEMRQESASA